jgi:methyl-accepting chemotaxis protein
MVFVLAAVIIVSVTQSIAKSVTGLETSTRRIANGELDIPVELKGSNEITSLAVSLNRMRLALRRRARGNRASSWRQP